MISQYKTQGDKSAKCVYSRHIANGGQLLLHVWKLGSVDKNNKNSNNNSNIEIHVIPRREAVEKKVSLTGTFPLFPLTTGR